MWCGHMEWLRLVGSLKLYVSFAEYRLFYRALLQKRPIILRSLLIVATPYHVYAWVVSRLWTSNVTHQWGGHTHERVMTEANHWARGTTPHCNTLQHTATRCNTLQHAATRCNTLQYESCLRREIERGPGSWHPTGAPRARTTHCNTLQHAATSCNTMQLAATCCNMLQHAATHCNTLHHAASCCITLQHAATRCNTLQHAATPEARDLARAEELASDSSASSSRSSSVFDCNSRCASYNTNATHMRESRQHICHTCRCTSNSRGKSVSEDSLSVIWMRYVRMSCRYDVSVCVCMYVYICMYACMYVCMFVCLYVC